MNFKDKIIRLSEVDSTNTYAREILKKFSTVVEGTTIVAGYQTSGSGQDGKIWESHKGKNILMSIILQPDFLKPDQIFYLNISIALAVYDFVKSFDISSVSIKWPNDIYAGDRKIGGLLIQNEIEYNRLKNSIAGIGVNVNQELFGADIPNPVSLKNLLNRETDVNACLADLLDCIENRYDQLKKKKFDELYSNYHNALYLLGREALFLDIRGEEFRGIIDGVRTDGRIRMITPQGMRFFEFREIRYIF
jgi:BirA family biotin operon repressor/biotin-[acetyl-CoA-carboxylase] ligase